MLLGSAGMVPLLLLNPYRIATHARLHDLSAVGSDFCDVINRLELMFVTTGLLEDLPNLTPKLAQFMFDEFSSDNLLE